VEAQARRTSTATAGAFPTTATTGTPTSIPAQDEACDGIDNDCDTVVDVDAESGVFWADADGDGYGGTKGDYSCQKTDGFVATRAIATTVTATCTRVPVETCNGQEDDCDGDRDEDAGLVWYEDDDGDGWGVESETITACIAPSGYVDDSGDCDDGNDRVNPGTNEVCGDLIDNDCDQLIDAKDTEVDLITWYLDAGSRRLGQRQDDREGLLAALRLRDRRGRLRR
jgi:hypothetical protein